MRLSNSFTHLSFGERFLLVCSWSSFLSSPNYPATQLFLCSNPHECRWQLPEPSLYSWKNTTFWINERIQTRTFSMSILLLYVCFSTTSVFCQTCWNVSARLLLQFYSQRARFLNGSFCKGENLWLNIHKRGKSGMKSIFLSFVIFKSILEFDTFWNW